MDLPGWQSLYEELKDQGLEIISAAQDTQGDEAALPWFDKANATFTQIVDTKHTISALYNMVNVPTGVWIDENGVMVRPPEVAYTSDVDMKFGQRKLYAAGSAYVAGIRDWVAKGADSEYALTPEEVMAQMKPRNDDQATAEAAFQLGVYFEAQGDDDRANRYWQQAQHLRPDDWNYHRQDWAFTPDEAGKNWMQKFNGMDEDEEYYPSLDLPGATDFDK